mmetsp:Transcript_2338/g.3412  ORF Transcript_2338/g.3412 Transcript_2338/m.3412 type:complete len:220 (-) Transcript_2338:1150-1809(-)
MGVEVLILVALSFVHTVHGFVATLQHGSFEFGSGLGVTSDEKVPRQQGVRCWLSGLPSADEDEETLLRMHVRPCDQSRTSEALTAVQAHVRSFPFAAVLPVQPLQYLPTDDGVEVTFLRKKTKEKGSFDGGIRFFVELLQDEEDPHGVNNEQDGISSVIRISAKRNSVGQTVRKIFSEKLVVKAFVASFTGNNGDCQVFVDPSKIAKVVAFQSMFHKWM